MIIAAETAVLVLLLLIFFLFIFKNHGCNNASALVGRFTGCGSIKRTIKSFASEDIPSQCDLRAKLGICVPSGLVSNSGKIPLNTT